MFNELPGPKDLNALPDEDPQNIEKTSEHENPEAAMSQFRARIKNLHDSLQTGEPDKIKVKNYKKVTEQQSIVSVIRRFSEMEAKLVEVLVDMQKMRLYVKSINWDNNTSFIALSATKSFWLNENIGVLDEGFRIFNKVGNKPILWVMAGKPMELPPNGQIEPEHILDFVETCKMK